jgi:outer membrane protein OmpA-like peptidoglycan-associated protein
MKTILGGKMFRYLPLFLLFALPANAQDRNGQISVGAGLGPVLEAPWATSEFRSAVGPGPRITFFGRYHHESNYSGFELALDYFRLSHRALSSRSLTLHYFWRFRPEAKIHPVMALGFGFAKARNFFVSGNFDTALFGLRAGVEYELDKNTDLAFHLDHFSIFKNEPTEPNLHVLSPSIKIIRYFGEPPAPVPVPAPEKSASAANVAEKQSVSITLDVKFRSGTSELSGSADAALSLLADILKKNPGLKVEIQGHTDSSGGKAKNQKLSQARADAVRDLLVRSYHIEASRLSAKGYGSSQPVDTNSTAAGRSRNRRVTAVAIQ